MARVEVIVTKDYERMSERATDAVAETLYERPTTFFCFPTGSTPVGMKRRIIRRYREGKLDFSKSRVIHCDEYVGLPYTHKRSYAREIYEDFIRHLNFKPQNIHLIDGMARDLDGYCKNIEETIKKYGGIDLCILGIGRDGHIAFNMPGSPFDSRTRVVNISEQTRCDNSRFFGGNVDLVPKQAITLGLATIMESKQVMLLSNGEHKSDAVYKAIEGEVTGDVPASVLQHHENALFIIDEAAASKLSSDFLEFCNFYYDTGTVSQSDRRSILA